jgi:putative FmdB family regulatory protein
LPIYEYRCSKGHQYERAEGFDAPSEHRCPSCSGRSRRQISLPAVIFKGSGFYSTDNRKSSYGGNGGSSTISPVSSGDALSHDSGSESKTEAATTD